MQVREAFAALEDKLMTVGNLIHDSVLIFDDEVSSISVMVYAGFVLIVCGSVFMVCGFLNMQAFNAEINVCGERRVAPPGQKLKNHVDLVEDLDIVDTKRGMYNSLWLPPQYCIFGFHWDSILDSGAKISGARGYILKGYGVLLNQALINYSLTSLTKKGFTTIQPNFLMRKEVMAKCAQLSQFDEELYKVSYIKIYLFSIKLWFWEKCFCFVLLRWLVKEMMTNTLLQLLNNLFVLTIKMNGSTLVSFP